MVREKEIELWLVWKEPQSRQRYVVGKLWYENDYKFRYIHSSEDCARKINHCGIDRAEKLGFTRLVPFPEMQVYSNTKLFYIFERRLLNRRRPDFAKLARELGLNESCTSLELLQATGGRLATDTIEFVTPFIFSRDGDFDVDFNVAGWRRYQGEQAINELSPGTLIRLVLEPDNPYDSFAIQVRSPSDIMLGYVPVYYSRYLDEVVRSGEYEARVLRVGPPGDPQIRLIVKVTGWAPYLAQVVEDLQRRKKAAIQ